MKIVRGVFFEVAFMLLRGFWGFVGVYWFLSAAGLIPDQSPLKMLAAGGLLDGIDVLCICVAFGVATSKMFQRGKA